MHTYVRTEIVNHLRADQGYIASPWSITMPCRKRILAVGPEDPYLQSSEQRKRKANVSRPLTERSAVEMGYRFDISRFVPFIVMHEFEGHHSSASARPSARYSPSRPGIRLPGDRNQAATPEDINDSPDTAPSKRIRATHAAIPKAVARGACRHLEIGFRASGGMPPFRRLAEDA